MEAVKFEKVHFSYPSGGNVATDEDIFSSDASFSLNGIDFSVQEGEFIAVLGHNGSGKSTLARLTNGLLTPDSGKITVLGLDATNEENLFNIRKQVGIVFQNPDNQTVASIVEDDIAFGPENVGIAREEIGKRIDFALNAVGMSEYRHSTTSRLSGGQKQRIAIAGVLALKPRVMILDESTAMLDPRGRKEVIDVVLKLNKEEKITVILITHFTEEALLADRAVVMHRGEIVMQGKPEEVLKREKELEKCSLTLPRPIKICQKLREGGLHVQDALTSETLSDEIVRELENIPVTLPAIWEKEEAPEQKFGGEIGRVECKNLSFTYNPASPFATHALNGVDLEIGAGEFFGIIGHTGSGKSTFVQHLNALIKLPTAEKKYKEKRKKVQENPTVLTVDGFDLTKKTTDFKALRKKVGMVFQYPEYQLFAETVFEDVAFGLKNFAEDLSEAEIEREVKEAIEIVGLNYEEVKNRSPFELSGGQKRRVAIAGVLVTRPEILVLDEPAAGLDPLGKEEIMSLLHKLHALWCKTIIVVSHDMDEIAENCTRAAIFSEGKILAVGTPKQLFERSAAMEKAGLDVPFVAKLVNALKARGVEIDCDLTVSDFIEKILKRAKTGGAGMRLSEIGGQNDA
ncbi:MAG: energy-coupling factor transporter ATPase [Clostridia bacterium]|nr:energy-coupling factor transporter ATPase [Clostridia bacterium]